MCISTVMPAALALSIALASGSLADHHKSGEHASDHDHAWVELFNGKDLTGWKVSENPDTFRVVDGEIVAKGDRAHLFYEGDGEGPLPEPPFKNFELKCKIMTKPSANSGIFFHTEFQDEGWPGKGYEVQVNQTHGDRIKTGSIYAVQDVLDNSPAEDNEWYTQHIIVKDKRVVVKVDGEVVNDYTEESDYQAPPDRAGRKFSSGTIALQGHDPGSEVHFRSVKIKPLD